MPARKRRRKNPTPSTSKEKLDESDIPEERFFLDPNAVSQHLYCSICQEVYDEPWRAPCGHSYCKKCISQWLANGQNNCPEDRQPLTWVKMHHDFIVENIIGDYQVACPWRPLGCENIGPLHLLKDHKKNCIFNPKDMPKEMRDYSKQMLTAATTSAVNITVQPPTQKQNESEKEPSVQPSLGSTGSSLLDTLIAQAEEEERRAHSPSSTSTDAAPVRITSESSDTAPELKQQSAFNSDDEGSSSTVPEPGLPSLRMRLYMSEKREKLCSFLEGPSSADETKSSKLKRKKTE